MAQELDCESLDSTYEKIVVNGEDFWVVLSMPKNKALCIKCVDAQGGASTIPTYLLELPA
jgi:hypothetical protein